MSRLTLLAFFNLLPLTTSIPTKRDNEWVYGAWYNKPFDVSTGCNVINAINPPLLANWGNNNGHDLGVGVCDNPSIHFLPNMYGRPQDNDELGKIPNDTPPWGIMLENEPTWRTSGPNMTAQVAADRYAGYKRTVDDKWGGTGNVRMISPSPLNRQYPKCKEGQTPGDGCVWEDYISWLQDYFEACGCLDDMWAINVHDYSCDVAMSRDVANAVLDAFPGKRVFFGELGCNTHDEVRHATYLTDFATWARGAPGVVGFMWSSINWVDTEFTRLTNDDASLTLVGQAFKRIQGDLPAAL